MLMSAMVAQGILHQGDGKDFRIDIEGCRFPIQPLIHGITKPKTALVDHSSEHVLPIAHAIQQNKTTSSMLLGPHSSTKLPKRHAQ